MEFPMLFSAAKIGSMEVANRFVVPPMATNLGNPDGTVSEALVEYWVTRASGGWGLLIVEFTAVDPLGKGLPLELGVWDDTFIPGLKRLTDVAHKHGVPIALQIHHAGRQTVSPIIGSQPVSASPIPCPLYKEIPRELSTEEVWLLVEKFGDAAVRTREAGFDAVEVHGAHGYLVAQFMSAYFNKRTDMFGGNLQNRMRFPVEIIKNIRRKVGTSYPILFRLSGEERVTGGRNADESKLVARMVQEAGVDAIDVSLGVYASINYIIAPAAVPAGFNLPPAAAIKKAVSVPVIAVGRITEPFLAEDALETGMADLIAFGRQSLADPKFPSKVAAGQLDEICPCTGCMEGCIGRVFAMKTVTCVGNPFCGREAELKVEPAATKKQVVVVGGGPAGLEAAWLAASRGHQVTLYEKAGVLGGQLRTGAIPPTKQDLAKTIAYLVRMGEKHGVSFKLQTEATSERILAEKPDVIVLAMGAMPAIPDVKGATGPKVVNAWDVLDGKKPVGANVLIVGGGMVGTETADFLGEHGHRVTIVEMLPDVASDVEGMTRGFLLERLKTYGVQIQTGATVQEFFDDGGLIKKDGQEIKLSGFDTIVLAMGTKPVNGLQKELEAKGIETYVIGDAASPRKALEAIEEGARLALKL